MRVQLVVEKEVEELNRESKWTKDLFSGGGRVSISRLAGENLFTFY